MNNNQVQPFTYVVCKIGSPGYIDRGKKYTVLSETENGYTLFEVSPPSPYTSFHKNRFDVLNEINLDLKYEHDLENLYWNEMHSE